MMLNHNLTMMNEDGTADPAGTALLPATGPPMLSKTMMGTTGLRSFGRRIARVGTGLLLLLLVAEGGAVVVPEKEDDEGALLWSNSVSSSPGRLRRVVGAGRAAPGAAAAEEGSARTPRRHRRTLVAKKNPQQAPPTEYDGAVVDVAVVDVDVAVVDVAVVEEYDVAAVDVSWQHWQPHCDSNNSDGSSNVLCPTRCEKLYTDCFALVNTCLKDPTCSEVYYKIITTCGCDADFTCAEGINYKGLHQDLSNCLFQYWDAPVRDCWVSGTVCVSGATCGNCCNGWMLDFCILLCTMGTCM